MKKQVIITGGTGLIGSKLVNKLSNEYKLILLTRNPDKYANTVNIEYKYWDGKSAITDLVDGCYGIINLIGENIGKKRWRKKQKDLILTSRQNAATAILESVKTCKTKPAVWIQASATGYYAQNSIKTALESSPKGQNSFLADVCDLWEQPIKNLKDNSVRKVIVRTGVVLASNSDLWKQLTLSFKFGIAAIPGNGKQVLPWIHIDDEVNAIVESLNNKSYTGIFNLAAPYSCTMKELVETIKTKKRNFITLPIPAFFLEIVFGKEMTHEVILTDQKVTPQHLLDMQFKFKYPTIKEAVENLSK